MNSKTIDGTHGLDIVFFSQETYPEGGAACNRHLAYVEALAACGHTVRVYAIGREACAYKTPRFEVTGVGVNASNRVLFYLKAFAAMLFLCLGLAKGSGRKSKWVYLGTSGLLLLPITLVARLRGIRTFHERTELPSLMVGASSFNKLDHALYKSLLRQFSGIYVISNRLRDEMKQGLGVAAEVSVVNMIVDLSRFENLTRDFGSSMRTITYCGDLSSPKDGVDILLTAFARFRADGADCTLQLAGSTANEYFRNTLRPLVEQLALVDAVKFLGLVPRQDVPALLASSDLLVLARPNSAQAAYGFPTKLGEYLASRKPVLVTNTGEISSFLSDGHDVFFSEPDDADAFAERMGYIGRNYQHALTVGQNGFTAAREHFSAGSAAKRIETMLMKP